MLIQGGCRIDNTLGFQYQSLECLFETVSDNTQSSLKSRSTMADLFGAVWSSFR